MDQGDTVALGAVIVGVGGRREKGLDVANDAGEQPDEAEFFTEFTAGLLFRVGRLVEGEGDGEGVFSFVEVGNVVDEGVLSACVDEAEGW